MYGLANAGKGSAEFVGNEDDGKMRSVVLKLLSCAMEPMLRNCEIVWPPQLSENMIQFPGKVRPIFNGERMLCTAIFRQVKFPLPESVVVQLKAKGPDGQEVTFNMPVKLEEAKEGNSLHKVAAYCVCKDLEGETSFLHFGKERVEKEKVDSLVVELGVKYQFATSLTSFVAVEEREEATEGSMKKEEVIPHRKPKQPLGREEERKNAKEDKKTKKPNSTLKRSTVLKKKAPEAQTKERAVPQKPASSNVGSRKLRHKSSQTVENAKFKVPDSKDAQLVFSQKVAGYWEPSQVALVTEISLEKLRESNPLQNQANLSEEVSLKLWATAVALAFLNNNFLSSKETWSLVEGKAKKFVKVNILNHKVEGVDILSEAHKLLSSL